MSDPPLLRAVREMRLDDPTPATAAATTATTTAATTAEQNETDEAQNKTGKADEASGPVTLLDLGSDMLAALAQSVGTAIGLPAFASTAASHRFLADACRRDDVWRALLQHELGIDMTKQMQIVAPTKQMLASGGPCIALMRALKCRPRHLLVAHTVTPKSKLQVPALASAPMVSGLSATFPVLQRARDHCVRSDMPLPLVDQHTCCRTRADGVVEVRLSGVAYFEVTIGEHFIPGGDHVDLCVAVGLCTDRFPLDGRMPGWDYHSCGFHGDDGFRFHGSGGNGQAFAEARGFEPGSIVGCGVLFDSHKVFHHLSANNNGGSVVFYTIDGELVGPAFMVPHLIRRLHRDPLTDMPLPADEPEAQKQPSPTEPNPNPKP